MADDELCIELADLTLPKHAEAIVALIDAYAREPIIGGKPLAADVRDRLVPALREHPTTIVWLAWLAGEPIGVAVAFVGFSTFAARTQINLHDLAVSRPARGRGVGKRLLETVEAEARNRGCCRVTLEVHENNERARRIYEKFGFLQATRGGGGTLFCWKMLDD